MQTDTFFPENDNFLSYLDGTHDPTKEDPLETDFQADPSLSPSKEKLTSKETENPFLASFLVELIHSIKNTLISIKNISLLSIDKFNDGEFRKYAQKSVSEDIKKIDSVLNSLLNYIHINTPIIKSNTISLILEEVLEANEKQIKSKTIKVFKKCEKDLPETFIHDEQVRFILNSILQYAILSTPVNGSIGLLIKSFDFQTGASPQKPSPERNGGYIEMSIGFTNEKESPDPLKEVSGKPSVQKEEPLKLILQLVKEILQKNHGNMTYEFDPKKMRTLINLRFPIERRKVIYYEPITI